MVLFKPVRCVESSLPEAVADGSLYVTTDTKKIYIDTSSERIQVQDVISVTNEAALPLVPLSDKLYAALEEGSLWTYSGGWVQLGSGSGSSYVLPVATTDTLGGVKIDDVTIKIDENGVISGINAYTKTETDELLNTKQDKLTSVSPLNIEYKIRSNLNGFEYTTDGTGIYATDDNKYLRINNDTNSKSFCEMPSGEINNSCIIINEDGSNTWTNYIDIPYKINQIAKIPKAPYNSTNLDYLYSSALLGYVDNNNNFFPIISSNSLTLISTENKNLYLYSNSCYTNDSIIRYSPSSDTTSRQYYNPDYRYIQLYEDQDTSLFSFQIYGNFGASNQNPTAQTYKYNITKQEYINRLKQINTIRIFPTSTSTMNGRSVATAYPVNNIKLFDTGVELFSYNDNFTTLESSTNYFDLSGEQAYNYLDLSIGAGLSISDGVLVNNNPTPYELPTASAETLGGVKVDGTSIVISDGVISTNTGTEVDTYTKGEVDILLAKKEDNITATQPLALEQKTSNTGSVGFTVSESNTLMPSSDAISLNMNTQNSGTMQSSFNNYIVIPYSYSEKTVVRIPCNSSEPPSNSTSAFLGYLDDGVVQPLVYFPICWSTNNASTNYVYTMDINNPNASTGTHPNNTAGSYNADGLIEGKYYSYLTTYYSPDWTQYGLTSYTKSGTTDDKDIICFQRYNFHSTEEKAAIEKANCVVISYGVSLNQFPIDLKICGKFPYKGDFATGAIPYDAPLDDVADLTNNILDFTTVTVNELSLNIDNSTIKVNDSGQLYADVSLPETITTQGNTFNGVNQLVQLDDEGKLPAIDGSQLTNLPAGSAPSNMVTTDTQQSITATKTIQDLKISGQSRQSIVLKTGALSYPNRYFIDIGDNNGVYNYIRLISQGEIETVNSTGTRWGKMLDTVNFATRVIAGSGINITKTNQGPTGDDIYTISSTSNTGSLKYWTGAEADYTAIETKDADTLYRTTDTNKVFLGEISLTGSGASANLQFSPLEDNGYSTVEDITIE